MPPSLSPGSDADPVVLVVDDELLIRWSLRERLGEAGYRVIEADSGAQARSHFDEHLDLVVLDIRLPDVDGLSLLHEFRNQCPDCPVIVISAYTNPETVENAQRAGALELVGKPFDVDRFVEIVENALASRAEA